MTRLIDADALEKEMCSGCEYSKSKYANCDDCAIANAPTIDAEPKAGEWIPCSKRLPDVGRGVLFCDSEWTEEGCLRADGDWWQFRWSTVMPKEKVTAWMPLPMPYRKESEVEP